MYTLEQTNNKRLSKYNCFVKCEFTITATMATACKLKLHQLRAQLAMVTSMTTNCKLKLLALVSNILHAPQYINKYQICHTHKSTPLWTLATP